MSATQWIGLGMVCAFGVWMYFEFRRAPIERDDMTRGQQEDAADVAADSMRGQLEQMRKDGAL